VNVLQHREKIGLPRSAVEMAEARALLRPFHLAGYRLILLSSTAKMPIEKGWQEVDYTRRVRPWLERGGNIGILLGDDDLVLDIDARNGGLESFQRLIDDLGLDVADIPAVLSGRGDGGKHIYLKKPAGLRVRAHLEGYPGIDIKTKGGFVLAPASRHPVTGGLYRPDPASPGIDRVVVAPDALLAVLERPVPRSRAVAGGGELTVDDLRLALSVLDPRDYGEGEYVRWIRLAAAAHDATNGDALEVWLEWAAQDERYSTEADYERNVTAWESFKAGRPGGANYLTLLWEVARAGRPDIARRLEPGLRFEREELNDFQVEPLALRPEDFLGDDV
jgi:hypothetical protein